MPSAEASAKGSSKACGENVDQAEILGGDDAAAMIGGEERGDLGRVACLVMVGGVEADRAGLDRAPARFGHEGDHRRAVDAAGKEGAQGHVGDHARGDPLAQPLDHLLLERLDRGADGIGEIDVPTLNRRRHRAAAAQMEIMAGGKLADALDDRGVVGDVAVSEIIVDRLRARASAQQGMGEQALQLGGEDEGAVGENGVEERLHAEPVAGEEQRIRLRRRRARRRTCR